MLNQRENIADGMYHSAKEQLIENEGPETGTTRRSLPRNKTDDAKCQASGSFSSGFIKPRPGDETGTNAKGQLHN